MELAKNIFFNTDKLLQNSRVKISYTGRFFEDGSSEVYLHYGFGTYWDNLSEVLMTKTDLGFQAEVDLLEDDTFNFCLKNQNNEWDNNDGENYIFDLERPTLDLILSDETTELDKPHRLNKAYLWSKKLRIAVYKIITYLPKIISGNYKRRVKDED